MKGWVKIHRKLLEWEWYGEHNTLILFIHLLLKANHKPKKHKGILIETGQIMTGLSSLSEQTGITIQKTRTALKNLKSTREITIKTSSKGTVIQIVKYEDYQIATSEITNEQQTNNKPTTTNKNVKNEKNKYTYNEFYDFELNESQNNAGYETFIKWIFGDNILERPLTGVLKMKEQMNFKQYQTLEKRWLALRDDKTIEHPKIQELLVNMENWVVKENKNYKTTIAGMMLTFLKNNTKKVKTW